MAYEFRNPKHNAFGGIDMEINHPAYGWIPFSADPGDIEPIGAEMYAAAMKKAAPAEPHPEPPALTKLYKADIWRRATDTEAEVIDGMLMSQPARLRRLWSDATFLSTTDELFTMIHAAAVQVFGEARANVLLQPTE